VTQRRLRSHRREIGRALIGVLLLALETHAVLAQPESAPPPAVTVAVVRSEDVSLRREFIARFEAIDSVDIRARVQGFIESVAFEEGQDVKPGDLLFSIEPDQYQAALAQAQAQVASTQATLLNAEVNLQRRQALASRGNISRADLDAATADRDTAKAAVAAAEANARVAQLNLGYTKIVSPIVGRIGRANITVGNLVGPDSSALARVVRLDPIRVVFSASERDILDVRQQSGNASQQQINAQFLPTLRLANGTTYDEQGKIEFLGNEVDPATGTVPIRVLFPNPNDILLPGGTASVTIRPAERKEMPVVPIAAVQETREGKSVLVVGADNRVEVRPIKASTQVGQNWAVEGGLNPGETIIVEGLQKVRPGAVVRPLPQATRGPSR
jgi:membrane fusion protein (multidrug efflux system)